MKSTYTRNTNCNIANFKHKPQKQADYAVIKIDLKQHKLGNDKIKSVVNAKMAELPDLKGVIVINRKREVIYKAIL